MSFRKTVCGSPAKETKDKNGEQTLKINEIYGPTIQGEGKTAGKPVLFLRTAGCNLACIWCDTPFTWNWEGTKFKHPEKFDRAKEIHEMSVDEIKSQLDTIGKDVKALVISGGEPMLQQQKLVPLLDVLKKDGYWLEIETNGTKAPTPEFEALINQINCSPKLSNSGPDNPLKRREVPEALTKLAQSDKTVFKFVVSSESDVPEILDLIQRYQMRNVYLMPLGKTLADQTKNQGIVADLCSKYKFNFSPRLHVTLWGDKRGV